MMERGGYRFSAQRVRPTSRRQPGEIHWAIYRRNLDSVGGQRHTMMERGAELPEDVRREITLAEGSQGPRRYRFSAQRVRPTSRRQPGEIHWAIYRRNLDSSEPRYYLSNAPEDTSLETLAHVGGSR